MDDNDIDRSSQRANLIEQRMFEITLTSIDTLKHSTAIEIRKSQNEMKKQLRKYRDRQREIVKSRPGSENNSIEELMTRQMKNKAKAREKTRPKTCPGKVRKLKNENRENENGDCYYSDSESDVEIDGSFMIDQQKSKIDLRPKTAMEISRRGVSLERYVDIGRLGPAVKQTRYFDEDELKDRGHFYMHLVDKRITDEKNRLNTLDDKVAEFCGTETIQTMTKKMQSKRKFFAKNPEWADSVNAKVKTTTQVVRKSSLNQNTATSTGRPRTSIGMKSNVNISSFRKSSYISTPS